MKKLVGKAKTPTEDPSVRVLRERQVRDLAELDEEENLRIKGSMQRRGIGKFRRTSTSGGGAGGGSAGSRGGRPTIASQSQPGGRGSIR